MTQFTPFGEAGYISAYSAASTQYVLGVTIQAAQQLAIAGLQLVAQQYIADKQFNIANRQMVIHESEYARAVSDFHPIDKALSVQVLTAVPYAADYVTQQNRVNITVAKKFARQRQQAFRRASAYCVGSIARIQNTIDEGEALAAIELSNVVFRQEEMRVDAKETEQYNRKLQVANIGNKLTAQAISGMTSAAGMMIRSLGGMSQNVTQALSAAGRSLGSLTDTYNQKSTADAMVYGQRYGSQPQAADNIQNFGSVSSSGSNQMENIRSDAAERLLNTPNTEGAGEY